MKIWLGIVLAVIVVGGGSYWWMKQNPSSHMPASQEQANTPATTQASTSVGTKDYTGAWFKVVYPANFTAQAVGEIYSYGAEKVSDEATFTSPDASVQFYVYSPQWSGDPVSYLHALPTETVESDTSTPTVTSSTNQYGTSYYKKVTRYITFAAKDGSYKRSAVSTIAGYVISADSTDYSSKTHLVFGIKYKDQATYDKYLSQYLAFKKSLVQYAD
jgi:hypothetical protein